jgi:hypothetical protein
MKVSADSHFSFQALAGLADGLALKELRYATSAAIRPN